MRGYLTMLEESLLQGKRAGIPVPRALLQEVADFLVALREGVYKTDSEFRVLLERLEIYIY